MADNDPQFTNKERWTFIVRVVVSAIFLIASLVVILKSDYPDATTKWAFGIAGLIIGYWLR
jgi:hypothetical protein